MIKTIGISGGSGFVGGHLSHQLLAEGHSVVIFSRSAKPAKGKLQYAQWDPVKGEIDIAALSRLDAMVHLAGAGVTDKRWTEARKAEILSSRTDATRFLVAQLRAHAPRCSAFIAASATGYYGPDRPGHMFVESDPPADDFLAQVCVQWEAASREASEQCRTVIFRFGIVLGRDGGAYPELAGPMKFGVMPVLGSGRQVVPWVHVEDLAGMIRTALEDEAFLGVYNAVSPNPVTNRALMEAIAKAKGGLKIPAPVPEFALKIIMGEASVEVLKSCTASADKVQEAGYVFRYPEVDGAVREIVEG